MPVALSNSTLAASHQQHAPATTSSAAELAAAITRVPGTPHSHIPGSLVVCGVRLQGGNAASALELLSGKQAAAGPSMGLYLYCAQPLPAKLLSAVLQDVQGMMQVGACMSHHHFPSAWLTTPDLYDTIATAAGREWY
jgi:hypothetical protein